MARGEVELDGLLRLVGNGTRRSGNQNSKLSIAISALVN